MPRHYVPTETRRQQIAEAALAVLAEEGVGRLTARTIAKRIGVTDGTLFRHFEDKQEIVLAAMGLLEAALLADLEVQGAPIERLEQMFRRRASFVGTHSSVGHLIFSEQLVHLAGEPGRDKVVGWRRATTGFMFTALQEAQAGGSIKAGLKIPILAQVIQGVLLTFALQANLGVAESEEQLSSRIDASWATLQTLIFS